MTKVTNPRCTSSPYIIGRLCPRKKALSQNPPPHPMLTLHRRCLTVGMKLSFGIIESH